MEPVSSPSAGASFPRLLVFRTPTMLKTRIAATTTLSRVLHLGLIQGTRKRLRIGAPTPKERVSRRRLLVVRAYNPPLNIFLEVCVRHVVSAPSPPYLRNRSAKRSAATETPPLSPAGSRNVF